MIYREATIKDIPGIQVVRNAVKENRLSDPSLVPDKDVETYICERGRGWVCEVDGTVRGFAIADLQGHNIWALFVDPDFEAKGIGKQLHRLMMNWYFSQTQETVWLGTAPASRAEKFYRLQGWEQKGMHGSKELKFEMSFGRWQQLRIEN